MTTLSEQPLPFCRKNKHKRHAFSVIELLMVVSIICILAAIGIPSLFNRASDGPLINSLNELELLCLCAQHSAYASNEQQCITINTMTKECCLTTKTQTWRFQLPATCHFGVIGRVCGPPAEPKEIITQAVTFPGEKTTYRIFFRPTGVISAGTAYIIDKDAGCMGALTCGVSQVSYIRKYMYKNHYWQLLKQ